MIDLRMAAEVQRQARAIEAFDPLSVIFIKNFSWHANIGVKFIIP